MSNLITAAAANQIGSASGFQWLETLDKDSGTLPIDFTPVVTFDGAYHQSIFVVRLNTVRRL